MVSYRPRIPVADPYLAALGRATYNFAYLEWGIIWLCETMRRGFIGTASSLTAGQIARQFEDLVNDATSADPDHMRLKTLAAAFIDLVVERNKLMHGKPYTAQGGEQRLLYNGKSGRQDWPTDEIIEAARSFETAALEAGALLHNGRYQAYQLPENTQIR